MRLSVRVTPKASRDQIVGWRGDVLAVRVKPAPEGGRANVAVCRLIAAAVHVPPSAVRVVHGSGARIKTIEIDAEDAQVRRAIGSPPEDPPSRVAGGAGSDDV